MASTALKSYQVRGDQEKGLELDLRVAQFLGFRPVCSLVTYLQAPLPPQLYAKEPAGEKSSCLRVLKVCERPGGLRLIKPVAQSSCLH